MGDAETQAPDDRSADTVVTRTSAKGSGFGLEAALTLARRNRLASQQDDGHWCYELEADATIPSEYVFMLHYFGDSEPAVEAGIANYLRHHQNAEGGWPLYESGAMDISCSVKAYYALKLCGDDPDAEHMQRARAAIRRQGGAARANVFTRITLALFQQMPWRGVPMVPVELILLPHRFPVNLDSVSYWSRTLVVPLSILCSLKPQAANPRDIHVSELFVTPPETETDYFGQPDSPLERVFLQLDAVGKRLESRFPARLRERALKKAERWLLPRLNGEDGLGAISPPMIASCQALQLLGYDTAASPVREARQSLRNLLVDRGNEMYCQPCVSPVWDTALSCRALQEHTLTAPDTAVDGSLAAAEAWLLGRQLWQTRGDWAADHPDLPSGGWAFQYHNAYYPDLDDTAVVAWVLHESPRRAQYTDAIRRAADWLVGMQSRNGGFGAFDADNDRQWLNSIPFADHGALLDPPTSDVTARVLMLLAILNRPEDVSVRQRALIFLRREQENDGSWFGRWGTNYIYGTWSVLLGLEALGLDQSDPVVRRAVAWLKSRQREDGSWGETNATYADPHLAGCDVRANAAQTAWALLGLMAAGAGRDAAVERGVGWLLRHQQADGGWEDAAYNAPGFPRVFYLKYHGYARFFPYWALARYWREQGSTSDM